MLLRRAAELLDKHQAFPFLCVPILLLQPLLDPGRMQGSGTAWAAEAWLGSLGRVMLQGL